MYTYEYVYKLKLKLLFVRKIKIQGKNKIAAQNKTLYCHYDNFHIEN